MKYDELAERMRKDARILAAARKKGIDPKKLPEYNAYQKDWEQMKKLQFDGKAMPYWLEEGANGSIAVELLEKAGERAPVCAPYLVENAVAEFLKSAVGKDIFHKGYWTGDFGIIAREFCKRKGIGEGKFYSIFGFGKGGIVNAKPEDVFKKLNSIDWVA